MTDPAPSLLPSPCVGVCRVDDASGWCLGCARTSGEIEAWHGLDAAAQHGVWDDLPRRVATLGLTSRLLRWQGDALLDRLADACREPGAGWSVGVYGAVAELPAPAGAPLAVEREPGGLVLRTPGGAMRLRLVPGARAFELTGRAGRVERVVLALHRARLGPMPGRGVAELGPDADAVDPARRADRLFDIGLGRRTARFCLRTGEPALVQALRAAVGRDALDPATGLVPRLLNASPDRVVASPLGRIEVAGPILGEGHEGAHTHLLPELLAQGRELEPGFALPEGYAACATLVQVPP